MQRASIYAKEEARQPVSVGDDEARNDEAVAKGKTAAADQKANR